jgi:hypothetical protein
MLAQARNNKPGPRPLYARQVPTTTKIEYILEHKGMKVIMTDHARTQARKRHGMPVEQMDLYFRKIVDGLIDFPWEYDNQEIFVYSGHYQRGVILTCRRDFKRPGISRCYVIVTMYPYGKARPIKEGTRVIYV